MYKAGMSVYSIFKKPPQFLTDKLNKVINNHINICMALRVFEAL